MNQRDLLMLVPPAVSLLIALLLLIFAYKTGRKRRLIDDLPTSKTTGVFIGFVELKGTAEVDHPLTSYLAGQRCVCYSFNVSERWSRTVTETYTDAQGKTRTRTRTESGWTSVASGGQQVPFYLKDDYGVIRVVPERAKIEPLEVFNRTVGRSDPLYYGKGPPRGVAHSDGVRSFTETAIPLHQMLFVVGQARERSDIVAPEIAYDPQAPMFLISTRSEEQVSAGMNVKFFALVFFAMLFCAAGWFVQAHLLGRDPAMYVERYVVSAVGGAVGAVLCWLWLATNSLVDLRHRVRQAWSLLDVQLKRRRDLIPNLVAAIEGLLGHERATQTALAEIRAQASATRPGLPGDDPHAISGQVRLLVESYPNLTADQAFLKLQDELINTEHRIALARAYVNDIVTHHNVRLLKIPDRFLAAMLKMTRQPLVEAADFERQAVRVSLAE